MSLQVERQVEDFYDREDKIYRSFWDSSGSLHWGYFDDLSESDPACYPAACQRWTDILLEKSALSPESNVLDVGCGNGNASLYLAQRTGCEVTGIDLSGVRIANAEVEANRRQVRNIRFRQASASELPFDEGSFSHVWSQATLYHVPDRERALQEILRVLAEGGRIILDDLVTPSASVTDLARRYVYDRLLFEPGPSHAEYKQLLRSAGFVVTADLDLTRHLRKSYELLIQRARLSPSHTEAYAAVVKSIDNGDVGWSAFTADKVTDKLTWVYDGSTRASTEEKYDAWSETYDDDLADSYRPCPETAAAELAGLVKDRGARILDVGAGTGMGGVALARHGFTNLTALDISSGMLEQARRKCVYRALVRHDLQQALPQQNGATYDAALATGVFTFSHARPDALTHIVNALADGGVLTVTFRTDYLERTPEVDRTLQDLPLRLIASRPIQVFEGEPMVVQSFQKSV